MAINSVEDYTAYKAYFNLRDADMANLLNFATVEMSLLTSGRLWFASNQLSEYAQGLASRLQRVPWPVTGVR